MKKHWPWHSHRPTFAAVSVAQHNMRATQTTDTDALHVACIPISVLAVAQLF